MMSHLWPTNSGGVESLTQKKQCSSCLLLAHSSVPKSQSFPYSKKVQKPDNLSIQLWKAIVPCKHRWGFLSAKHTEINDPGMVCSRDWAVGYTTWKFWYLHTITTIDLYMYIITTARLRISKFYAITILYGTPACSFAQGQPLVHSQTVTFRCVREYI